MKSLPVFLVIVLSVLALTVAHAAPVKFDLPAQPAAKALVAFAGQSGVEVLFSYDDLRKVQANEVVGTYEPEEALERLLRGTGFSAKRSSTGKFVVTREPAKTAEIRGTIVAKSDGVAVVGAMVRVESYPSITAVTGAEGTYTLMNVPREAVSLIVRAEGYTGVRVSSINLRTADRMELNPVPLNAATNDGIQELDVFVSEVEQPIQLSKVVVTPSRFGIAEERGSTNVTLTRKELERLPQLGEDLFRTISRLPGLSCNDLSAKFLVRGAPNNQMLTRFDGVDLIEPFHLKDYDGALSIIDMETIGSIDLITGGFTTDYGDRLAGVLTVETQQDFRANRRTTLGLSVTSMRATSQGQFADGKGQWLAAARRGYIDLALKLGGTEVKDSPTYYDISAKVQYQLNPHHTLSLHTLYAADSFERVHEANDPDLRSSYDSAYVWARWRGQFGENLSEESVLSFSQLDWHRKGDGVFDQIHPFTLRDDRRLVTLGLRQDWTLNLTERALVRTGFEYKSGEARYDYKMSRARWALRNGELSTETRILDYALRPDGDSEAAYVALRAQPWTPLIIEPGVRFEHNTWAGDSDWSPRFNASLALGRTTFRAAWGVYKQAQGLHELSVQDRETTFKPAEQAEQRVISISHRLKSGVDLRAEGYERLSSHLRPHWGNLVDPFDFFAEALYDRTRFAPTRGRARGVELIAERRNGRRFGWGVSYAYAVSEEKIDGRWIPRLWDQKHTLYTDLTYVPAPNWQLSASWQFHTGWPYTDQIFYLERLNNGDLIYSWTYGPTNALRGPDYHRLDLRATRVFQLKHGTLRVYVDIFNALNRQNGIGFDEHHASIRQGQLVVVKTPGTMLPILPSAGLSWTF